LWLSGCTGLPLDKPPPRLFVLTPKTTFPADLPKVDWQLSVDPPIAQASLNTSRIAVHHTPISLDYYQGANWVDTAPKMLQTLLVESFESTGKIVGVGRQSVALRADYNLVTELREFQAELDKGEFPIVRVRLNVKLVRFPQRVIVATTSKEVVTPAAGSRIEDVVNAFDESLGKALKAIVSWTLRSAPPVLPVRPIR
jgi:cholesterol transport system auxiliary component